MTNVWSPSIGFLKAQSCDLAGLGKVSWSFTELGRSLMPFRYIECHLQVGEISARGYAESIGLKNALVKSLAEAWERFWMMKQGREGFGNLLTSNGFAAGADLAHAKSRAEEELIERQWILTAWQSMSGFERVEILPLRVQLARLFFIAEGYNLRFFKVCFHGKSVLAGLATSTTEGAVFDAVFGLEPEKFIKLSRSLLRAIVIGRSLNPTTTPYQLPEQGHPADHLRFYRCPRNLVAFDFLNARVPKSFDAFDHRGIQVEEVYTGGLLPAVARAWHPDWIRLSWGKISIQGQNPWPHPIA